MNTGEAGFIIIEIQCEIAEVAVFLITHVNVLCIFADMTLLLGPLVTYPNYCTDVKMKLE